MRYFSKILFCVSWCFFFFFASGPAAGDDARRQTLLEFSQERSRQRELERAEVLAFAEAAGIPVRVELDDGSVIELKRVIDGFPVFDQTYNLGAAETSSVDAVWPGGGAGLSLTGAGETPGIWDAGAVLLTHQEFGGRVT